MLPFQRFAFAGGSGGFGGRLFCRDRFVKPLSGFGVPGGERRNAFVGFRQQQMASGPEPGLRGFGVAVPLPVCRTDRRLLFPPRVAGFGRRVLRIARPQSDSRLFPCSLLPAP